MTYCLQRKPHIRLLFILEGGSTLSFKVASYKHSPEKRLRGKKEAESVHSQEVREGRAPGELSFNSGPFTFSQ